jgi:RNA polymerase sigma-70 factor, ECF subfamily
MRLFQRRASRADFEREAMPHLPALYGAAMRLCRNEGDAEDLVQETLLRGYRFFDTFEAGTNCKAWLFRILTNTFRNGYRENEREQEILDEVESSDANLGQFVSAAPRDTESALLGHMVSRDVEQAMAAIPAEFRLAVVLADLEDFSYKEIADIMECPAGTVMSRLFRGRKMLQKLLYSYALEQGIVKPTSTPPGDLDLEKTSLEATGRAGSDEAHSDNPPLDLASYRRAKARKGEG